ncbi:MAG: Flp pilus assembly complex ATPase component TadA [Planctomycetes bacterium]|nr:Flp pilus assembly complex ATPase component TadA [Planctomycetota bacterium]
MLHLPTRPRLGECLIELGAISEGDLSTALAAQGEPVSNGNGSLRLGDLLVELGLVEPSRLQDGLARHFGIERVSVRKLQIDRDALDTLPPDFVTDRQALPLALADGTLRLAIGEPGDPRLIEDVRLLSGAEVEVVLADRSELADKIAECHEVTVERMVEDLYDESDAALRHDNLHDIEVMASEPTVINLVNLIISSAVKDRASDVHLVPFENRIELRYRVDGVLLEIPPPPRHLHAAIISRIKIMAEMNIAERFIPQDGRIQIQSSGRRVDIRVGSMPTVHGESVVMRLLEKGQRILTMTELGLDAARGRQLQAAVEKPHGIFLATGPTGSGKTTSLYSVLHSIYTPEKKILTIEDPVEYELPGVAQIPVRPSRGFTFATGLRAILRQDPDVIMVGEIRDTETAEIAVRAALTGHLVFSTLHTNDAAGAVTRLTDMGIEPFLIASSLEGVLAQRLVRRICTSCRRSGPVPSTTLEKFHLHGIEIDTTHGDYCAGLGCDDCRGTGYRGRVGLYELLLFDSELRETVLARASSAEIKRRALKNMTTVLADGLNKAAAGETTLDEVLRVALDQGGH